MKSTKLQQALIDAGMTELAFHNGGTDYPVKVGDLPDASLVAIIAYGKRMFNDHVNSAKGQGKDPGQVADEWLTKARNGELGTRAGGARVSPYTKALRDIVAEYLKAAGWDAKEAAKDAKKPEDAFKTMLALQIARGRGVPVADVPEEDVAKAHEANWPKMEKRAQAMVDALSGDLDIDL